MTSRALVFIASILALAGVSHGAAIDRHALVTRNSPSITHIDKAAPFMVGNGNFAFTADITGLQTFPEQYSSFVPLITEAQWAWHSFPNPKGYTLDSAQKIVKVRGKKQKYPWIENWDEARQDNIRWLRENPHKFSLGRVGFVLSRADGKTGTFDDVRDTHQTLDLWNGRIESSFRFDGEAVDVETSVLPDRDGLVVHVTSRLLADGRLGLSLRFPGVAAQLNPDPADWSHPEAHTTREVARGAGGLVLSRQIDDTRYVVRVASGRALAIENDAPHSWRLAAPGVADLTLLVEFAANDATSPLPDPSLARASVASWWQSYWTHGGVVDFTGSRDPRAKELERRIVLSQYLTAVNSAGEMPPQEEGLFSNSWNGKFHLEMVGWHEAHFAVWGRPELLERSMGWYLARLDDARARAKSHGVKGAWWPKMVGPEGRESPSVVNPFILWQQPTPIYLAEVLYDARQDRATLEKYRSLVFDTADMLASVLYFDAKAQRFMLGPPVMPAQETHPPLTTFNPTFELEYFRFGIETAQQWRQRLGMARDKAWDNVLFRLSKLPEKDGLYLAAESQPDLWDRAHSADCSRVAKSADCPNRDHPSMVAALGLLPGWGADRETMRRTLREVVSHWDLRQTWGWDPPMLAMTATRLDEPEMAVDLLLGDFRNFQFGASGMTPRFHVTDTGFVQDAETYLPSNGSLLLAVGLMVAGGKSVHELNPGFPPNGQWIVHSEGIHPLP